MDQREKLIEMLRYSLCSHKNDCTDCKYKKYELCVETMVADHLLANGVVVLPCRCVECKHYGFILTCGCSRIETSEYGIATMKPDDFCSYGERKGGDE